WLRNDGETPFCTVCWPARGCVWRLPTRARSVCNGSSRGVAALFSRALFLAACFGEPDPSCHAGAAGPARGCSRALLVSLNNARHLGSFRIRRVARQGLRRTAAGLFTTALSTREGQHLRPLVRERARCPCLFLCCPRFPVRTCQQVRFPRFLPKSKAGRH